MADGLGEVPVLMIVIDGPEQNRQQDGKNQDQLVHAPIIRRKSGQQPGLSASVPETLRTPGAANRRRMRDVILLPSFFSYVCY